MAPHTVGGLVGGMAHDGHIHHENYGFISANGPAPMSAFSHSSDLHLGNLDAMAHGGHTPRTAHMGYFPKFTYLEGLVASLVTSHG
jgi:hypothetical protein